MKHESFNDYPAEGMDLAERGLLTAWDALGDYADDLVLVGGLAVRHLTRPPVAGLPGPVTTDVDFGIHIGVSSGTFPMLEEHMVQSGFRWTGQRFERRVGSLALFVDLLTDDDHSMSGTTRVDDKLSVGIIPGISRALRARRVVDVRGRMLDGTARTMKVLVAEAGPMLVLKLNAFGGPQGRKAGKDVHDILYLAMNYLDGVEAAVEGFAREKAAGNRGMDGAMDCLRSFFRDEGSPGPVACAKFRLGGGVGLGGDESVRIRTECVTLAHALLAC